MLKLTLVVIFPVLTSTVIQCEITYVHVNCGELKTQASGVITVS